MVAPYAVYTTPMTDDTKAAALQFLQERSLGVLATLSPTGTPRARTVYYATDASLSIYFCTLTHTRKIEDIAHDAHGAFVVSDDTSPKTLQIEGTIEDLTETATITPVVQTLIATFMKHGTDFAPLTHLDPGTIVFYKLTPTWIRFGDFTDGFGAQKTFTELTA